MPSAITIRPRYDNVLIFGATGEVGSAAALEACSRGARVWLGLRNVDKESQYLSSEMEEAAGMIRVHADLSYPESLAKAVRESGAKAAYIYSVRSADHMRSSLSAMKQAGIEYIVFLSTNGVKRAWKEKNNLCSITPDFFIPWKHAQVEIALEELEIFHTAIRPGFFASNPFRMYLDNTTSPSRARILAADVPNDPIDPVSIGRASGALLVNPSLGKELGFQLTEKKQTVSLNGPALISQRQQWKIINQILISEGQRPVEFAEITKEEYVSHLMAKHCVPRPVAESLARSLAEATHEDADYIDSRKNVERITGHPGANFDEFVKRELRKYLV